jgi:hypothetical protein
MRSESLELLDQYDAVALQLGRMHIPLKKKWAAYQAVITPRLQKLEECHDRAHAARLSTELGEGKFSEAQIRRLDTEVQSLAGSLSSGMATLRNSIEEMHLMRSTAASDAAVPVRASLPDSGGTPPLPGIPVASLLHPGSAASAHSAASAESAPDSAAPPDSPTEVTERAARRRRICRSRNTEVRENEKLRTRMHEWMRRNPAAPRHSAEDCTAKKADCSDWHLSLRLTAELFPVIEHLQAKNVDFVEWSIRHMAAKGKREPMINGTRTCGGYSKDGLIRSYAAASPEAPQIAASVFNNKRVPMLGTLWNIAEELAYNTRRQSLDSRS